MGRIHWTTLKLLKEAFPCVDVRLLKGAVLEHGDDYNAAANFILEEIESQSEAAPSSSSFASPSYPPSSPAPPSPPGIRRKQSGPSPPKHSPSSAVTSVPTSSPALEASSSSSPSPSPSLSPGPSSFPSSSPPVADSPAQQTQEKQQVCFPTPSTSEACGVTLSSLPTCSPRAPPFPADAARDEVECSAAADAPADMGAGSGEIADAHPSIAVQGAGVQDESGASTEQTSGYVPGEDATVLGSGSATVLGEGHSSAGHVALPSGDAEDAPADTAPSASPATSVEDKPAEHSQGSSPNLPGSHNITAIVPPSAALESAGFVPSPAVDVEQSGSVCEESLVVNGKDTGTEGSLRTEGEDGNQLAVAVDCEIESVREEAQEEQEGSKSELDMGREAPVNSAAAEEASGGLLTTLWAGELQQRGAEGKAEQEDLKGACETRSESELVRDATKTEEAGRSKRCFDNGAEEEEKIGGSNEDGVMGKEGEEVGEVQMVGGEVKEQGGEENEKGGDEAKEERKGADEEGKEEGEMREEGKGGAQGAKVNAGREHVDEEENSDKLEGSRMFGSAHSSFQESEVEEAHLQSLVQTSKDGKDMLESRLTGVRVLLSEVTQLETSLSAVALEEDAATEVVLRRLKEAEASLQRMRDVHGMASSRLQSERADLFFRARHLKSRILAVKDSSRSALASLDEFEAELRSKLQQLSAAQSKEREDGRVRREETERAIGAMESEVQQIAVEVEEMQREDARCGQLRDFLDSRSAAVGIIEYEVSQMRHDLGQLVSDFPHPSSQSTPTHRLPGTPCPSTSEQSSTEAPTSSLLPTVTAASASASLRASGGTAMNSTSRSDTSNSAWKGVETVGATGASSLSGSSIMGSEVDLPAAGNSNREGREGRFSVLSGRSRDLGDSMGEGSRESSRLFSSRGSGHAPFTPSTFAATGRADNASAALGAFDSSGAFPVLTPSPSAAILAAEEFCTALLNATGGGRVPSISRTPAPSSKFPVETPCSVSAENRKEGKAEVVARALGGASSMHPAAPNSSPLSTSPGESTGNSQGNSATPSPLPSAAATPTHLSPSPSALATSSSLLQSAVTAPSSSQVSEGENLQSFSDSANAVQGKPGSKEVMGAEAMEKGEAHGPQKAGPAPFMPGSQEMSSVSGGEQLQAQLRAENCGTPGREDAAGVPASHAAGGAAAENNSSDGNISDEEYDKNAWEYVNM